MAGIAKPDYPVRYEADFKLLGSVGGTGNVSGLFDGKTPNAWNTNEVFYFVKGSNASVELEFPYKVVIHRYYSWNNDNNQRLKIMRHDGQGYNEDFTHLHLPVGDQAPYSWRQFTEVLSPGKYKFTLDETDSSKAGRIEGEWYVESMEPLRKYLFKDNGEIKSYMEGISGWDPQNSSGSLSFTNNFKTVAIPNILYTARTNRGVSAGKWYWEFKMNKASVGMVGISNTNASLIGANHSSENVRYYYVNGKKYPGAENYASGFADGDVIGVALDMDSGTITFYKNGISLGVASSTVKNMGKVFPTIGSGSSTGGPTVSLHELSSEFVHPVPVGYQPYGVTNGWKVIEAESLSKQVFEIYGISRLEIIKREEIEQLITDQVELLCWTDEVSPVRKATIYGVPDHGLLIGINDIEVGNSDSLTINQVGSSNGIIRVICSGDNGMTWMGTSQVDLSDNASIISNGFTPETLNGLSKEQIEVLFPNGFARFSFYMEQNNSDEVVQVESLLVGEKEYTISPTATDLSLIYEVLQEEKPTLYASRDDGVSWKEISQDEMASLTEQPEGKSLRVKAVLKNGQEIHAMSYAWA